MKKYFKYFRDFAILLCYLVALIGGVGYTVYNKAYVVTVAVVMLGVIAFPQLKKAWQNLING